MSKCICCKGKAIYSVLLAGGPHSDRRNSPRWYLPNQSVREHPTDVMQEIWFCHPCMRAVEDNLRATIAYLQAEGGAVAKRKKKFITELASGKSSKSKNAP
jgi:hypothetical protein